jgi:hypothetical protein
MAYKARFVELYPTLHLSLVKCTGKPKAAGFTRIRVYEELNEGMMQVKPTAKDFTECKDQIFISLQFPLNTYPVSQEKIQKDSKYHLSHGPHIVMVHRNLSGYNLAGPISPNFGNLLSLTSL